MSEVIPKKQLTIAEGFEFSGVGIHTGEKCRVRVSPAPENHGIVFEKNNVDIPAVIQNISNTARCTTIGWASTRLCTIEHFMAACHGLGIDNVHVEVNGGEMPIMDGSALEITQMLRKAGVREQEENKKFLRIQKFIKYRKDDSFIIATPANYFSLSVMVNYNNPHVGLQLVQYDPQKDSFEEKLAPARTFGFKEEVQALLDRQLALGGSLDNALIISDEGYMNEPRFPDEPGRHKCLDVLGDLALSGGNIIGHIFAYKPGHDVNAGFVKVLLDHCGYKYQES